MVTILSAKKWHIDGELTIDYLRNSYLFDLLTQISSIIRDLRHESGGQVRQTYGAQVRFATTIVNIQSSVFNFRFRIWQYDSIG